MKDLLGSVDFKSESPKTVSEFYLTLIASDGYKVVFSWNEIFNTEVGDHTYLITEKDGKKIQDLNERILVLSASDYKTGRRYIKGLQEIVVGRVK